MYFKYYVLIKAFFSINVDILIQILKNIYNYYILCKNGTEIWEIQKLL